MSCYTGRRIRSARITPGIYPLHFPHRHSSRFFTSGIGGLQGGFGAVSAAVGDAGVAVTGARQDRDKCTHLASRLMNVMLLML